MVALLSIPVFDGPHSRQYANEAAAVSKLRAVTTLEKKFAAAYVEKGFACELPLLQPVESDQTLLIMTRCAFSQLERVRGTSSYSATAVPTRREWLFTTRPQPCLSSAAKRAFMHSVQMIPACSGMTPRGLRQTA